MLELLLFILMVITIARIATADGQSAIVWGGVALGLGILCLAVPLPYGRVLLAAVLSVAGMVAYKVVANR